MSPLLYLVHRIPYPPNKGDKIRSYHVLRFLRERYRIYLGAFMDSEEDHDYAGEVRDLCEEAFLPGLNPVAARAASLRGLACGTALTLPYYHRRAMQRWVDRVIAREGIGQVVVFSAAMAQYVAGSSYVGLNRIIDFVDVDSDKWRQYGESMGWPWSWVYRREARTLLEFETRIAREFDRSTFVSPAEADHFRSIAPECADRITSFSNGVDLDYFDPSLVFPNPYLPDEKVIVFTGAMDYWANVDAVTWFTHEVFPRIHRADGSARFYIVGSNPGPKVLELAGEAVVVTGRVPDVRPYLAHAALAVAPLRIAQGIQNKVLEAMAMARPVVVSPEAAQGIPAEHDRDLLVEADPGAMARRIAVHLATGGYAEIGRRGREFVARHYMWAANLAVLGACLEHGREIAGADGAVQRNRSAMV